MRRPYANFGYAVESERARPQIREMDVKTQPAALKKLAELAMRATVHPLIRNTAVKIVRGCASREDKCELQAIFKAVLHGDPEIEPLAYGVKYIADPRYADYFESPVDLLNQCLRGACGTDCDGQAALHVALAGALGWKCGLRAWAPKGGKAYSHVYAVCAYPKRPPFERAIALDTTVEPGSFGAASGTLGWEPPKGEILTAWTV